jgi:uncharacterized RDD family membrane protein YckC
VSGEPLTNPYAAPDAELYAAPPPRHEFGTERYRPARLGARFLAFLIDLGLFLIWTIVFRILSFGLAVVVGLLLGPSGGEVPAVVLVAALVVLFVAPLVLVPAWLEASAWQGTPGKSLLGLLVTDREFRPITLGRAIRRNLIKLLGILPYGVGLLWAIFNRQHLALHDRLAGTRVVEPEPIPLSVFLDPVTKRHQE